METSLTAQSLSRTLSLLHVIHNIFEGSLNFTLLPESLNALLLRNNSFSGEIDVSHFHAGLKDLDV